jgi:hypothetical protein
VDLFRVPPGQALTALRTLKAVAVANGRFADTERTLLEIAAHLYGLDVDVDALKPIAPEDLAQEVSSFDDRLRLLQGCLIMALADGEATEDEWKVLEALRNALEVDDARMKVFHDVARGRRRLAKKALGRQLASMRPAPPEAAGTFGVVRRFFQQLGLGASDDPARAERYRGCRSYADGTLGKAYAETCRALGHPLPFEPGGPPESTVHHDLLRVLTGYGADPRGELDLAAFTAGMKHEDPFAYLFFPLLALCAGLDISPTAATDKGHFEPARFARALARGAACNADLTEGWDYWPMMDRNVDEVRKTYNISPPEPG